MEPSHRGTIHLKQVTKSFGEMVAVLDLSLEVRAGEFLALLGPSGCGKTTTLRMLSGFEEPDSGEILISGDSVLGVPPHRRDVNTVFQAYALFPHMNVAENVAFGLRQKRTPRAEVDKRVGEALEMVRLNSLAKRKPNQLSGGQQQRVALARALVNRPSVLLLDEPLGALDRKLREEMQIELKLLQTQLNTTFVFVTHDQEEAMSMSDRIAVMNAGQIEQLADPFTIYDAPASAFVASFIGQQNTFEGVAQETGKIVVSQRVTLQSSRTQKVITSGSLAIATVRPDAIAVRELTSNSSDASEARKSNSIRGVLAAVAHLGESIQYLVAVANGPEIIARVPRVQNENNQRIEVGRDVLCFWNPKDVYVFEPTPPESKTMTTRKVMQ
jgi:spermidine/putrescine transport system ATP-binding protein